MPLQGEDATVTVVHSRTPNPQAICAEADIIVAGIGKPEMVRGDWIKPGAAVIDVGTNPIPVRLSSPMPPKLPLLDCAERILCVFALQRRTQHSCVLPPSSCFPEMKRERDSERAAEESLVAAG